MLALQIFFARWLLFMAENHFLGAQFDCVPCILDRYNAVDRRDANIATIFPPTPFTTGWNADMSKLINICQFMFYLIYIFLYVKWTSVDAYGKANYKTNGARIRKKIKLICFKLNATLRRVLLILIPTNHHGQQNRYPTIV